MSMLGVANVGHIHYAYAYVRAWACMGVHGRAGLRVQTVSYLRMHLPDCHCHNRPTDVWNSKPPIDELSDRKSSLLNADVMMNNE